MKQYLFIFLALNYPCIGNAPVTNSMVVSKIKMQNKQIIKQYNTHIIMPHIHNPLNSILPIWNAGMGGGIAGAQLVATICESGGVGILGTGSLPHEMVDALIIQTRKLTNKPFGANILIPLSDGSDVSACFDNQIEILTLFWGDPKPYLKDAHNRGMFVACQVGSTEEAILAAEAGVDAVILQGIEAGGHVSATQSLDAIILDTIKELGSIPVIASGGISSGGEIRRMLKLGARAVSLGTIFVATNEANSHHEYQKRICETSAKDTVITTMYSTGWENAPHRVIKTKYMEEYNERQVKGESFDKARESKAGHINKNGKKIDLPELTIYPPTKEYVGDIDYLPLYAGQSVENIVSIKSASEVLSRLASEMSEKN